MYNRIKIYFKYYQENVKSPIMIEIGFNIYFLLRFIQPFITSEHREYKSKLIDLMPPETELPRPNHYNIVYDLI